MEKSISAAPSPLSAEVYTCRGPFCCIDALFEELSPSKPSAFVLYLFTITTLEMQPRKLCAGSAKTHLASLKITTLGYCLGGVSAYVHIYMFLVNGRLTFSSIQRPGGKTFNESRFPRSYEIPGTEPLRSHHQQKDS